MKGMHGPGRALRSAATIPILALATFVAYQCRASALTAGVVDLVLILLLAFRWGFLEGAIASAAAVASLDFFFMPPLFSLYENKPQDWIATCVFALIAVFLSRFADTLHRQAAQTDFERARLERLYLTSRDILLMDRGAEIGAQLTRLIEDVFRADVVALWDAREARMDKSDRGIVANDEIRSIYFDELLETSTCEDSSCMEPARCCSAETSNRLVSVTGWISSSRVLTPTSWRLPSPTNWLVSHGQYCSGASRIGLRFW
jgi:two-component system sensor histidine kinase KdpD